MKSTRKRKENKKAIEKIAELLGEGVIDSFGWYGITAAAPRISEIIEPTEQPAASDEDVADENDADEEEYEEPIYYYDPEDVQGALDEAISQLIEEQLVPQFTSPKKPPTLSDLFAVLFGEQSDLKKQAEYFEELISGYEDRAHIDDLKKAFNVLTDILDTIAPKSNET